jgi:hypothetical protein
MAIVTPSAGHVKGGKLLTDQRQLPDEHAVGRTREHEVGEVGAEDSRAGSGVIGPAW